MISARAVAAGRTVLMSSDAPSDPPSARPSATDGDAALAATLTEPGADIVDTAAGDPAAAPADTGAIDTDEPAGLPEHEGGSKPTDVSLLVREGDVAADYLEQFLDIVDYDGDIDLDVENGRAIVAIVGSDLDPLVGAGGTTLDALQELTRLAVQQKTGVRSRLMLDISGHRSNRRKQLTDLAQATARTVVADGAAVQMAPMNPFERKVVHDAISAIDGVRSESEGDEPQRRVVVHPDR